jgi:hypothetical protein
MLKAYFKNSCGEGGIRTHGTIASTRTFQARSFGHSDTSPIMLLYLVFILFHSATLERSPSD